MIDECKLYDTQYPMSVHCWVGIYQHWDLQCTCTSCARLEIHVTNKGVITLYIVTLTTNIDRKAIIMITYSTT